MSYENAPATKLVATHCAACARPLVDAVSVEIGMGPDCREKYGFEIDCGAESRAEVNAKVHAIAAGKLSTVELAAELLMIRAHGFAKLADKLEDRFVSVEVHAVDSKTIAIASPFSPDFTAALKASTPWRRWDSVSKLWVVPAEKKIKDRLFAAMRRCFPGTLGRGPDGMLFAIEARS